MINANEFRNFLIESGYSEFSKSGRRSTVYDYAFRVQRVCAEEKLTLKALADKIDEILPSYTDNGIKWDLGRLSHESVINALKAFNRFIKTQPIETETKSIFNFGSKQLLAN